MAISALAWLRPMVLLAALALPAGGLAQPPYPFVVTGVVVNSGHSRLIEDFVRTLSESAGYPLKPVFVSSYQRLSELLREHPGAIGWTCGAPFVEDRKAYGQQLVAVPLFKGRPLYYSVVLTRRDRSQRHLMDFKGQVFAYSDSRSNSGYVSPAFFLQRQGVEIRKFFRLLIHTGSHERSIEALLGGLADVAAVDEYVWVEYQRGHPDGTAVLHEIERMGPFPFTPIVAGPALKPEELGRIERSLRALASTAQGRTLLGAFGLDGFVHKPPEFFTPIATMVDALGTGRPVP